MAEKKKKEPRAAISAAAERTGIKWCKHGINEKFCISCKKPVKEAKEKEEAKK
jgi:hypothetical protein